MPLLLLAQGQPTSLCADVGENGEVLLSWEYGDAVPSTVYEVYRDVGLGAGFEGPLTPPVGFPDLSFNDVGAGANLGSISYYVIDRDAPIGTIPDTISTIFLELIPTGASSVAQLEWNFPFEPMPLGGEIIIERSEAGAAFIELETLPPSADSYLDTLYSVCVLTEFTYRVKYERGGCSMRSQEESGEFEDDVGPPAAVVETISVDPETGEVTIYWNASEAADLERYVIQIVSTVFNETTQQVDTLYEPIGFVPGDSLNFSLGLPASNSPLTWVVLAKDSCDIDRSFNGQHTTMGVNVAYEECNDFVTVDWTPYSEGEDGWPEGVRNYEIRAKVDGADVLMADTVTIDAFNFLDEFDVEVDPNKEYRFYIRANSNGDQRPSTSNGALILTEYPLIATFFYQSSVSTNLQDEIEVTLYQDGNGVGTSYDLYKAEESGSFDLIATIPSVPGEDTIKYVDTDVRVNEFVYTYYWTATDGCGKLIGDSNEGSNIVLESRTNRNDLVNRLTWSEYIGWDGSVVEYQIFRGLGDEEPMLYDGTDPNTTEWFEDVEQFLTNQGRFCYRIQAVESTNQFGPGAISYSNLSCVTQEPLVWIPSAMVYGGFNDQFKPVLGFVDFETYRMEIYNKWGELLFRTSDIEMGWDGTYQGNAVPEDYYRYIISFKDGGGKPFVEEGRLYMVRNAE
jgi:gliding motility-associated-like protein